MTIQEMIRAIHASGLNDYRIAELTGIHQSSVFNLRKGKLKTVVYETGKRVEILYNQIKRRGAVAGIGKKGRHPPCGVAADDDREATAGVFNDVKKKAPTAIRSCVKTVIRSLI